MLGSWVYHVFIHTAYFSQHIAVPLPTRLSAAHLPPGGRERLRRNCPTNRNLTPWYLKLMTFPQGEGGQKGRMRGPYTGPPRQQHLRREKKNVLIGLTQHGAQNARSNGHVILSERVAERSGSLISMIAGGDHTIRASRRIFAPI